MNKRSAITVEPLKKDKRASLSFKNSNVHFGGWSFDLKDREGGIEDHKEECALAVLEYLTKRLHKAIKNKALIPEPPEKDELPAPQLAFEAERMACLAINFAAQKA